jgi:hypothetical protein
LGAWNCSIWDRWSFKDEQGRQNGTCTKLEGWWLRMKKQKQKEKQKQKQKPINRADSSMHMSILPEQWYPIPTCNTLPCRMLLTGEPTMQTLSKNSSP